MPSSASSSSWVPPSLLNVKHARSMPTNSSTSTTLTMFDKQIQLRMGQCNVKRWTEDLLPLVDDPSDPLGVLDLKTHTASLDVMTSQVVQPGDGRDSADG